MSDLRGASYPPDSFPDRASDLRHNERFEQRLGWASLAFGLGLLGCGVALALSAHELLSPAAGAAAVAVLLGLVLVGSSRRRASRRLVLALRGRAIGIYESDARVDVIDVGEIVHLGLYAGHVVTMALLPLFAAALCVLGLTQDEMPARIAGGVGVLAWVAIAASGVALRGLCLHFYVPVRGVRRRVALSRRDGDALLAAHPKTGGWRVTE